jgi:hypothetical protein
MGSWSETAAVAALSHPKCLRAFDLEVVPPTADESITIDYQLRCRSCGGSTFWLGSFPLIAPDPSPYSGLAPGEVFLRPPHRANCVNCGVIEQIFDPRVDGYDAILNDVSGYECGDEGETFAPSAFQVMVSLTFNAELSELREYATEAGVEVVDLFDWIAVQGDTGNPSVRFEEGYECA